MNYPDLRGLLVCREFLSDPVLLIMGEYLLSAVDYGGIFAEFGQRQ